MMALCLLCGSDALWAAAGTIQVLIGSARISKHAGQERPALRGDQLYEGDTVMTNPNSNVQIRMIDDAIIWVRPDSQFRIEKYQSDKHGAPKNQAVLNLISGTMREVTGAIGKGAPADYKLATPNATIGIRGTEFDATFATSQMAEQLNIEPGTYNRVYVGSTVLEGPSGRVTLNKDEAGFMGLDPSDKPQILPSIPLFMSTKAPTTPARTEVAVAKPKSLQITLRYGEPESESISSTSNRDTNAEQRLQTIEGERASLTMMQGPGPRQAGQAGARPVQQVALEVIAKLKDGSATVQLWAQNLSVGSASTQASKVATTLTVPLNVWTEVNGRGPSNNVTISSGSARGDYTRLFLKVEDLDR